VSIAPSLSTRAPVHPVMQLQRAIGNQAVLRLMRSGALQPKLAISQPGDVYEREADRVADEVMRMPSPTLQRTCAPCAAGGLPCPKCAAERKDSVQRKAKHVSDTTATVPDSFVNDLGPGQPLDSATRSYFEPRFGYDFSQVRIHTNTQAAASARAVNALAYTVGRDVVFEAGQYVPSSVEGRRLLAHELTHVMQQRQATLARVLFRMPSVADWDYKNTGRTSSDNCCSLCPMALGLDNSPSSGFSNGIEMTVFILDDDSSYTYDVKRWLHGKIWQNVGGVWTEIPGAAIGPNHMDDRHNDDECLTPQITVPFLPYIYAIDSPGSGSRSNPTGNPSATGYAQIGNFTEFVRIRNSRGMQTDDPKTFKWHVVVRATKSGTTWLFDAHNSEIEPGHRSNLNP